MPALGNWQQINEQFLDYSGERASIKPAIHTREITALTIGDFLTDLSLFETALYAITLGQVSKRSFSVETVVSNTRPTDKMAQVETVMLVTYIDDVTEAPYSFQIPTADYDAFNYASPPAGDEVIITAPGWSAATEAFITTFEDIARSPGNDANSVTITGMRIVR